MAAPLTAALAACLAPPPAVVQLDPPRPAPPATPPPAASVAVAEAGIFEGHERHRVAFVIHPGEPPCTFVFDGHHHEESAGAFELLEISRLAVEESAVCAADVLIDVPHLRRKQPDIEFLWGGYFVKPGHRPPPDDEEGRYGRNQITDLDFDGFADVCVVDRGSAPPGYSHWCWLFHPKTRRFVRHRGLEDHQNITVNAAKGTLSSLQWIGADYWMRKELRWSVGKLEALWEERTCATRFDLGPLPPGYKRWRQRKELRGGRMVVVFDGPEKIDLYPVR